MITLGDADNIDLTLEEINRLSYDRIKFCRSTMTVDGGSVSLAVML